MTALFPRPSEKSAGYRTGLPHDSEMKMSSGRVLDWPASLFTLPRAAERGLLATRERAVQPQLRAGPMRGPRVAARRQQCLRKVKASGRAGGCGSVRGGAGAWREGVDACRATGGRSMLMLRKVKECASSPSSRRRSSCHARRAPSERKSTTCGAPAACAAAEEGLGGASQWLSSRQETIKPPGNSF